MLGLGLVLGFAMICFGHGHLCLTGCRNSAPKKHAHARHKIAETRYDTIRYDTRCYFNVRSKADMIHDTKIHVYTQTREMRVGSENIRVGY